MWELPTQTGVDHVHAHPRHVGHRSLDLILALTAVFISAVSLYVAVDHGRTERELVRANARLVQAASWPFLQMKGHFADSGPSTFSLVNAGIGPAKLESLVVLLDGQPMDTTSELLEHCCAYPSEKDARRQLAPNGVDVYALNRSVIRPGESDTVLSIPGSTGNNTLDRRFVDQAQRITFRACYCSVFDTCWITTFEDLSPRQVAQCPVEAHTFNRPPPHFTASPRAAAAGGDTPPARP